MGMAVNIYTPDDMTKLIELAQKFGAKRLKVGDFEVEFFVPVQPSSAEGESIPSVPPNCACGHPLVEHNDAGFCFQGCPEDKCEVKDK